ncbi:MAG: hypothetical protein HY682_07060 [Chloroflexi bacterium]|nr:hypothetical protein [Chloroflexota bacterium]
MQCESCGDAYDGQFEIEGLGPFCRTCYTILAAIIDHPDFCILSFSAHVQPPFSIN